MGDGWVMWESCLGVGGEVGMMGCMGKVASTGIRVGYRHHTYLSSPGGARWEEGLRQLASCAVLLRAGAASFTEWYVRRAAR